MILVESILYTLICMRFMLLDKKHVLKIANTQKLLRRYDNSVNSIYYRIYRASIFIRMSLSVDVILIFQAEIISLIDLT